MSTLVGTPAVSLHMVRVFARARTHLDRHSSVPIHCMLVCHCLHLNKEAQAVNAAFVGLTSLCM